jgi:hypothetical protein
LNIEGVKTWKNLSRLHVFCAPLGQAFTGRGRPTQPDPLCTIAHRKSVEHRRSEGVKNPSDLPAFCDSPGQAFIVGASRLSRPIRFARLRIAKASNTEGVKV